MNYELTNRLHRRFRTAMAVFMCGLVVSGLTAFPLRWEVGTLASWLQISSETDFGSLVGLRYWIAFVRAGLNDTYSHYPFMAYATDWLAFAHLAIAVFFLGPLREPTRHDWTLISGIIACIGVIPLALICGALRGIPFYWRCIDCSFGLFGAVPLAYCLWLSRRMKSAPINSDRL
jgi:hypothetical protein